jgi:hypothetical protein
MRSNNVIEKIICTESLTNLIAQQNLVNKKNPKAAKLKDLLAEEGNNLKVIRNSVLTGIKGYEEADDAAKKFLEQEV